VQKLNGRNTGINVTALTCFLPIRKESRLKMMLKKYGRNNSDTIPDTYVEKQQNKKYS
jgi:hypothetical protein